MDEPPHKRGRSWPPKTDPDPIFSSELEIVNNVVVGIRGRDTEGEIVENAALTHLTLPSTVTSVGNSAFMHCRALTSIEWSDQITSIGKYAFISCNQLSSLKLPGNLTSVGKEAFAQCETDEWITDSDSDSGQCEGLTSLMFPDSLTRVGPGAFKCCGNLTSVTFGNGLTTLDEDLFICCHSLRFLTLPDGLTSIGNFCFFDCGLVKITLPNTLRKIGQKAFGECKQLEAVSLPSMLTSVEKYAFKKCDNLASVLLPHEFNHTHVGKYAFHKCVKLHTVVFRPSRTRLSFMVWAVGNSRNRANWRQTTVKYLRNVLHLITALAWEVSDRDWVTLDRGGVKGIFDDCPALTGSVKLENTDSDSDDNNN